MNPMSFKLVLAGVFVIFLSSLSVSASGISHAPRIHEKDSASTSYNWGGYAVTGPKGAVTDVVGAWIVPAVDCASTPNSYSSFWVGIDGYNSKTVEQIGTDSDCKGTTPTYSAWYEFYPKMAYTITSMNVQPGDVIQAEVKYTGNGGFTATIRNLRTNKNFSISQKVNRADQSSAEWIFEAPSSGGILPLANFGTVNLGLDYTGIASTNTATVNNVKGPIGSFGTLAVQQITMNSKSNPSIIKAQPSALTADGTSFTGKWLNKGP